MQTAASPATVRKLGLVIKLPGYSGCNVPYYLFHLDVPRLSVDIDINYVGQAELKAMQAARPGFERALGACCEREGCQVRRAPGEHAGGKYRLRYVGGVGGPGSLEVDVNYVQRIPLLGAERRRPRFLHGGETPEIPVLTLEELAAGKCAALLTRAAPRDAFDALQLLGIASDLLERPALRLAFTVQVGSSREDLRVRPPDSSPVSAKAVREEFSRSSGLTHVRLTVIPTGLPRNSHRFGRGWLPRCLPGASPSGNSWIAS